jgi:hypothetical protein
MYNTNYCFLSQKGHFPFTHVELIEFDPLTNTVTNDSIQIPDWPPPTHIQASQQLLICPAQAINAQIHFILSLFCMIV